MILKSPIDKIAFTHNSLFTVSARSAWKHLLDFFRIESPKKILLPAYIGYTEREGSGVFDPVLQTKTPYEFYALNSDLTFNIDEIEKSFRSGNIRMFLVVHYFGFCKNDIEGLKKLCLKYDVILVEDCAHAYTYGNEYYHLGHYGDFSFYSLHKFFPVESGGILLINNANYIIPELTKHEKCNYEILIQVLSSNYQSIVKKRRDNYEYLHSLLNGISEIQTLYQLDKFTIPQSFPILIEGVSREKLYFNLMQKNIPTISLYYRLVKEIDKDKFPKSYEISNKILNLPIHQDTSISDINNLVQQIRIALVELTK
jgi:dTDP-4-amino-4,6-dideoxygalactose transaminase